MHLRILTHSVLGLWQVLRFAPGLGKFSLFDISALPGIHFWTKIAYAPSEGATLDAAVFGRSLGQA